MSVVLSEDRQRVLLLRREVFILWDLPGGAIEKGESPADAAVRETREESGYAIALERFVGQYLCQSIYSAGDQLTYVFRARVVGGKAKHFGLETTGLRWFPVHALPRGVEPLQRQMIADALADLPESVERRIDFARWKLYPARVIFFFMRIRNVTAYHLLKWWRKKRGMRGSAGEGETRRRNSPALPLSSSSSRKEMPTMKLCGRVWKYGDDVNTDVIFPGKYTYTITDPKEQAQHALEDLDPNFASQVQPGDIIVAGKNWGNGSSREQAATCLKYSGVTAIIAQSFARIHFRNLVNNGLVPIVCARAVDAIQNGETIEIDLDAHTIHCAAGAFDFPPLSPTLFTIIETGGLIPMLRRKLGTEHLPMPEIKGGE